MRGRANGQDGARRPSRARAAIVSHTTTTSAAGKQEGRAPTRRPPLLFRTGFRPPRGTYSCAGIGSIVRGSTGTCTSSRKGDVIMKTRIFGKASMNAM